MPRAYADRNSSPAPNSGGRLAEGARRFASPAMKAALARRGAELAGLVLGLVGLALLVALVSYNPDDPSFSKATNALPTNLAGPVGAVVADLLLQGFGWAALLPVGVALGWAWRLATQKGLAPFPWRLAAVVVALPMLAAALDLAPLPAASDNLAGAGGAAGGMLAGWITGGVAGLLGPLGGLGAQVGIVALAGSLSFAALGVPLLAWRQAGRAAGHAARGSVGLTARLVRRSVAEPEPPAHYAAAWREQERDAAQEDGPSIGTRLAAPFRAVGGAVGGLFARRAEAPSPQLAAMLRAADVAAAEADHMPPRPAGAPRIRQAPQLPPPGARRAPSFSGRPGPAAAPAPSPAPWDEPEEQEEELEEMAAPRRAEPEPPRRAERAAPPPRRAAPPPPEPSQFELPPLELLTPPPARRATGPTEEALQNNARLLESVLEDYGVRGRIVEIRPGPVVTLYELEPAPGTKSARVIGLADDIARSMSVMAVRIATVPGRNVIGIELPNAKRETVYFSELLITDDWSRQSGKLPLVLGKDIGGAPVIADLARMPHLLIAGTTGSGKSVGINTMILSLLYRFTPDECRFIMIDPKMLELSVYDRIPHLLAPVVTEPPKAIGALKWTVREMERRYRAMSQLGVRNIGGYNEKVQAALARGEVLTRRVQTGFDPDTGKPVFEDQPLALAPLPMIVVVIDEMADLMLVAGKEIEAAVQRLAQMARAAGIHVIMATQRPSVDVITGTIKANFPTRISFQVTSKIDSRTILGEMGAEQLLGQGDMLHMAGGGRVSRVHGPFVSDQEVERVVEWLREQGEPAYIEEVTESDEEGGDNGMSGIAGASDGEKGLFDQAVALVTREGKASTSFIQRHLSIGYNRAAKLIEQMEKEGVVGPANHVGKREVLARRTDD
ncbi:DNA translocase FtsK [Pseudoroseomonas cervicalis]|uniref:FtsK/SpoIIIE family DNA translocase n=1 Tax=Teichococcus cervicalis TaxID=204525 RepID=UPI0027835726|nr:DNA translocase FtsK [Pseudoroseomonas cervicalis]MDQ1081335.1 S-DNA-T family DNA segregation ATPase FtsK/SpoIIIE [Pseudoroseomonas cervicalis]